MADVSETTTFEDPAQAISQGKRHLLVRDYSMAVTALAQGCAMLATQHGEMADELGEPFLLYGRALLCLSREEAGVLGSGVPGTEDAEEDGEEVDGEEEEGDAEGEGEGEGDGDGEEEDEAAEKDKEEDNEEGKSAEKEVEKSSTEEKSKEEKTEEKAEEKSKEKVEEKSKEKAEESKPSVAEAATAESSSSSASEAAAGPSQGEKLTNGEASTSAIHQNGVHENGDDDAEDVDNEDDDDANSNLQLAWEVLELAKLILLKRGPPGWKLLAEANRLLGEVAMESGNQPGALTDLNACLDLLSKIDPVDPRSLAETHYQLGLAHSLGNEFDASIEQFQKATSLLESRIKELEAITDPPKSDDPFYSIEGEIKELKELLPEIQDKITDMRDFKQQACKLVIEGIKNRVASGSCSNGAGPSGEGSSSSSAAKDVVSPKQVKPASDISHLVRKKRKNEDDETEVASPCKKPTPEKST